MAKRTLSAGNTPPSDQLELGSPYEVLSENVGFLEAVVDSVQFAADAKRHQPVRGYCNETLASTVRAVKWLEGRQRLDQLRELPAESLDAVVAILERELTIGTVEQIEELLTPAVRVLRDDLELQKWPRKLAHEFELPAQVMLATGPPYDRETCMAAAVLYLDARNQSRFIAPLDWSNVDRYSLERGIRRRLESGENVVQLDRELDQLDRHLPRESKPVEGWKGHIPAEPIDCPAALLDWLSMQHVNLLFMQEVPEMFGDKTVLESGKQILRNSRLLLDHWGEVEFPRCHISRLSTSDEAEEAVAELLHWLRSQLNASSDNKSTKSPQDPKRRGRKKANLDTVQREEKLAASWDQARQTGVYKGDFARDNGTSIKELDRLLDRVHARQRTSE